MINLISFFYKPDFYYQHKDNLDIIIQSLQFHIDNLEKVGFDKSRIIIKTNFDFSYKDIVSKPFKYNNCSNLFLTKLIATYEILTEYPSEIVWQHDHDTYQIRKFDMNLLDSQLTHDINMCNYWQGNDRPQGASVFYRGLSDDIKRLYSIITETNIDLCDERLFMYFMNNYSHKINLNLPYEYNTSLTKFTSRRRFVEYPFCVHGNVLTRRFDRRLYEYYLNKTIN